MKRLHIVGCQRSGTTLMFELLSSCMKHGSRCEHEQSVFNALTNDDVDGIYLSKKPSDITHIEAIFRADPELYLIYLLRDPRAVITSIHPSKADRYFSSFERWLRYESAALPLKSHPRFLQVNYETLVSSPDSVQQQILTYFPFLEQLHPFSEFEKHAITSKPAEISLRGLRSVNTDSNDNWREHLPRIAFQVQQYPQLLNKLVEYQYEDNTDWVNCLNGVSPRAQHYGEKKAAPWKKLETDLRYWWKGKRYLWRKKRKHRGQTS